MSQLGLGEVVTEHDFTPPSAWPDLLRALTFGQPLSNLLLLSLQGGQLHNLKLKEKKNIPNKKILLNEVFKKMSCAQSLECLPGVHGILSFTPTAKVVQCPIPGIPAHGRWRQGIRKSRSVPVLHSRFEASWEFLMLCFRTKRNLYV